MPRKKPFNYLKGFFISAKMLNLRHEKNRLKNPQNI